MSSSFDLMFHVTTPAAATQLRGLSSACQRVGCSWGVFLTNDAVTLASEPWFEPLAESSARAVVCEASWQRFLPAADCPVESGSQTTNSEMVSCAKRVISL